jgi:hypothetical protein
VPGSKREYVYTVHPRPDDLRRVTRQARATLGWACDGDKRVECYGVTGEALGLVQFRFTVVARDQWYSRQLAQDILNIITWGLENPAEVQLASTRLPPHEMRGYLHGRSKRWRDRGKSPDPVRPADSDSDHAPPDADDAG